MKKIKVASFIGEEDKHSHYYGNNGVLKKTLEKKFGEEIIFYAFGPSLDERFIELGKDADVVITDCYDFDHENHSDCNRHGKKYVYNIINDLRYENSKAKFFARTSERNKVHEIHKFAKPIDIGDNGFYIDLIVLALELAKFKRDYENINEKKVLLVDSNDKNLIKTKNKFFNTGHLVTCDSYLDALDLIRQYEFDLICVNLLMQASGENQIEQYQYLVVEKKIIAGFYIALEALAQKTKNIVVYSDDKISDHPAIYAASQISSFGGIKMICKNTKKIIDIINNNL